MSWYTVIYYICRVWVSKSLVIYHGTIGTNCWKSRSQTFSEAWLSFIFRLALININVFHFFFYFIKLVLCLGVAAKRFIYIQSLPQDELLSLRS